MCTSAELNRVAVFDNADFFPVANNAELERSYLAARGNSEKPVLLSVEGHFTLEANPDTGAPTKVLAPDTAGKFYPNQDCSSLGL